MNNLLCGKNTCSFDAVKAVSDILNSWDEMPAEIGFEAFPENDGRLSLKLELVPGAAVDYFYYDGSASSYLPIRIYSRRICNDTAESQSVANSLYMISDFLLSFSFPYQSGNVILRCAELIKLPFRSFSGKDGCDEFCAEFGIHYFIKNDGADSVLRKDV